MRALSKIKKITRKMPGIAALKSPAKLVMKLPTKITQKTPGLSALMKISVPNKRALALLSVPPRKNFAPVPKPPAPKPTTSATRYSTQSAAPVGLAALMQSQPPAVGIVAKQNSPEHKVQALSKLSLVEKIYDDRLGNRVLKPIAGAVVGAGATAGGCAATAAADGLVYFCAAALMGAVIGAWRAYRGHH